MNKPLYILLAILTSSTYATSLAISCPDITTLSRVQPEKATLSENDKNLTIVYLQPFLYQHTLWNAYVEMPSTKLGNVYQIKNLLTEAFSKTEPQDISPIYSNKYDIYYCRYHTIDINPEIKVFSYFFN